MHPVIEKEVQEKILNAFKGRISYLGIKNNTKTYYKEQSAFIAGVWTALDLNKLTIPPIWAIYCSSNRSLLDLEKEKQTVEENPQQ